MRVMTDVKDILDRKNRKRDVISRIKRYTEVTAFVSVIMGFNLMLVVGLLWKI